ncbi:glycerol-3-phosphate 1-O-acyltransferase PlsY [Lysobacter hankyongensis]|uniref:Glycerol-3-phosphate acyltransferase n=1 Tax=Lysobacter hankyongensis TaxID=1176535 RepID=A0ABP9BH36_9GAMM
MNSIVLSSGLILAAYLLGSLSGSLLLGRLRGIDIRTQGSGNAGGTNAFRTQGAKFALGVVIIDIGKGALAAWLGLRFADASNAAWLAYATAFAAALGHVWPLWHGFRGGKGAATVVGGIAVLWPMAIPVLLAVWLGTLILTGYVGLSTILTGLTVAILALATQADAPRLAFAVAIALLLLFTHRANVARLRAGTESRFDKARLLHRMTRRA